MTSPRRLPETREWAAGISKPTINLYLFDIRENAVLKNPSPWMVRGGPNNTAIKSRPDVRVDVNYNITAFANAVQDEHRLLNRVMTTLFQYPVIPEDLLQGQVSGQEIPAVIGQASAVIQSPADYWGVLDNDIKPSIDYRLTVRLDLSQELSVGLVLTSQVKVGRKINARVITDVDELPFHIGGKLYREGDPEGGVPAATLTLLERALDVVTGSDGRYSFSGVPAGHYTLIISAPGTDDQARTLQVPSNNYDVVI